MPRLVGKEIGSIGYGLMGNSLTLHHQNLKLTLSQA
jgi:hypothetical protein